MKCPFCLNEVSRFHPNSHIIPEWMYVDSYDERHRVVSLNLKDKTKKVVQKGLRGSFICEDCEDNFANDDDYASQLFTDKKVNSKIRDSLKIEKKILRLDSGLTDISHWNNFDFIRLQKFVFSVLIRAHLWGRRNGSALLPENEYLLMRFLYLNVVVFDDHSFPILIISLDKSEMGPILLLPYMNFFGFENVYTFAGAEILFHILRPTLKRSDFIQGLQVRRDGNFWMIHVPFEESGIFRNSLPSILEIRQKYKS